MAKIVFNISKIIRILQIYSLVRLIAVLKIEKEPDFSVNFLKMRKKKEWT